MPGHRFLITAAGEEPTVVPEGAIPGCDTYVPDEAEARNWAIALSGLEALQEIARKGAAQKEKLRIQRAFSVATPDLATPDREAEQSYAAPLAPLRVRDGQELSTFFDRADMDSIEADILNLLSHLFPEPCWEDDLFEFLQDLLGHKSTSPSPSEAAASSLPRVDVFLRS